MSSHCGLVSVTGWHYVQPSYEEPKLNGFWIFFWRCVVVGGGFGYWLVSSQGIVNSTVWHQYILLFVLGLYWKLLNEKVIFIQTVSNLHFLLAQSKHFCYALSVLFWYTDMAASGEYVPPDGLFARSFCFNWDWTIAAFCCFFLHKSNSSNILIKCIWIYLSAL